MQEMNDKRRSATYEKKTTDKNMCTSLGRTDKLG
jgi:hypothetical protein